MANYNDATTRDLDMKIKALGDRITQTELRNRATIKASNDAELSMDRNNALKDAKPLEQKIWFRAWVDFKEDIDALVNKLTEAIFALWEPGCHYIVFFAVIGLLIYGVTWITFGAEATNNYIATNISSTQGIRGTYNRMIVGFNPQYNIRSTFSWMGATSNANVTKVPRTLEGNGRCDNKTFFDTTNDGAAGHCIAAEQPEDIRWEMKTDTASMPEWSHLPQTFKDANMEKLTVYMPYAVTDTFFTPQCDQTYYIDKDGQKRPVNLFNDNGLSCGKKTVDSTLYNEFKYRDASGYGYT